MSKVATQEKGADSRKGSKLARQFVSFCIFQVESAWRRLSKEERERGKDEFEKVVHSFVSEKKCQILPYTTVGMKSDADIMLWVIAEEMDTVQELASALASTGLGNYLSRPYSFLSMTKRSMYIDKLNPEHEEDRVHLIPGKYKYLFVYPFVKKREWYLLPLTERQEMMDEHIKIGSRYPSVKLNTTYSFGLDDQEFVVAFETDMPSDFLDLVQELRESKASAYTLRDTPIVTCIARTLRGALDSLGG